MRYTYIFTQISREENGESAPITDEPYKFVFTFGKQINKVLGKTPHSDNTVLLTKDMWKEYPADNKGLLPTVCFSTPSQQGYRRPLVMSKKADKRAGVYEYKEAIRPIDLKKDQYISSKIRSLTETFVKGVRVMNEDKVFIHYEDLETANVKYLMSYIKSEVYKHLLQDNDNRGKIRAEAFLKKVLKDFFSLIPDSIIKKFDEGLEAHDKIREKLEGLPKDDIDTINAVLESQRYFKTYEDYRLFVALHKYILSVKNNFNHLVWVLYRSKIGMVSLKNVRAQLSAIFGFVCKGRDKSKPKNEEQILDEMCPKKLSCRNAVKGFLKDIKEQFEVKNLNKSQQAALCYKFQKEINHKYLNAKFYYEDEVEKQKNEIVVEKEGEKEEVNDIYRPRNQERFRDLCLLFWEIEEENTLKPNKCLHLMDKFSEEPNDKKFWVSMKEFH
jgi:hypothetical protein